MFDRHIRRLLVAVVAVMVLAAAAPAAAGEAVERPIKENLSGHLIGMELSPTFPGGDTFDGRCSEPSQWVLMSTGRGADVARAMALPVFGGMLIEPFTTFIVPTVYCAYMEFKMRLGLRDGSWTTSEQIQPDSLLGQVGSLSGSVTGLDLRQTAG